MQFKNRRLMSILLIFAILIGIFPVGAKNVGAQSLEPKTVNGTTTFTYQGNQDTKKLNLAGNMNEWDPENITLEKGDNNLFSKDLDLPAGKYEYKFIIDGKWMEGDNLEYVVEGIKIVSDDSVKIGSSI